MMIIVISLFESAYILKKAIFVMNRSLCLAFFVRKE